MANGQFFREYKLTDSELTMFTQHICDCITRDITEFAAFNVLPANVTALQTLCDAFEIFPTDEFINQEYLSATEVKDNLIDEIKVMLRSIALRVELKWGKSSPKYKSLGIADMSQLNDEAFTTRARMLAAFAEDYLSDLASEGLTQIIIDDLNGKIQDLDDAKREQIEKASYRIEKTTERITKGNELYNLVARYCEIGKRIWDGVNPAKYADYVIYGSSSPSSLTAVANFVYSLENRQFTWDAVENATSYQIEESADQTTWTEIYAGEFNNFGFTPSVSGTMYYRCRARNSGGYGDFSAIYPLEFLDVLPAPQNLQIAATGPAGSDLQLTWDAVPTATSYWAYRSVVAIGAPAGSFSFQHDTITESPYVQTVAAGNRYYYKFKAVNPLRESDFSDIVFVDVV